MRVDEHKGSRAGFYAHLRVELCEKIAHCHTMMQYKDKKYFYLGLLHRTQREQAELLRLEREKITTIRTDFLAPPIDIPPVTEKARI